MKDLTAFYRPGPGRRSGRVRDYKLGQKLWFSIFAFVGIVTIVITQNPIPVVLIVIALVGAWSFDSGVGYQLPSVWLERRRAKHRKGRLGGTEEEPAVFSKRPQDFFGQIGTMYDDRDDTDTVYFECQGFAPANEDPVDRFNADEALAGVIRRAIAQTTFNIDYGFTVGSRPQHPYKWAGRVQQRYDHPNAVRTAEGMPPEFAERTLDEWIQDAQNRGLEAARAFRMTNQEKVFQDIAHNGKRFYRTIYIKVRRPSNWKKFLEKPEQFTPADFRDSPLARVLNVIRQGLTDTGFIGVRMETYDQIRERIWNGYNSLKDHEAAAKGKPLYYDPRTSPWPQERVEQHGDYLQTDDTFHAVIKLTHFHREEYLPDGLDDLLVGHPDYVIVTTHASTTSAKWDRFYLREIRIFNYTRQQSRNALPEQADLDQAARDAQRINELYRSGSKGVRLNYTVLVSASSLEELRFSLDREKAKLREPDIDNYVVKGPQLAREVEAALFGGTAG